MRKVPFINGEFYHIYNRGVDKRDIFSNEYDIDRFFQSMKEFNVIEPIGSIYANSFHQTELVLRRPTSKLVNIVCYCLNSNHYHILLEQLFVVGISEFMKRLGGGYTKFFNEKQKRNGALFQGRFKSVHVNSNEYLLHVSAYINLNDQVHALGRQTPATSKLVKSSWGEYAGNSSSQDFCKKDMILEQFNNSGEYKIFAKETADWMIERRREDKKLGDLLLEE